VLNFTFIGAEMWEYGPKLSKFGILLTNLLLGGDSFENFFNEILSICVHFFFYSGRFWEKINKVKHFLAVGAFSHKFSFAYSGRTTDHKI